jgi:glucose uptake protein GlcU
MIQLLWIELVMKLSAGLVLLTIPLTTIKVLGLPRSETAFWPRLLGAVLIGLAAATFMDASVRLGHGLALGGSFAINVVSALTLCGILTLQKGPTPLRGRIVLWGLVAVLILLAFLQIPYL